MFDRDEQVRDENTITGTVEFCGDQSVGDPWQRLFEVCLEYQEIARQRAAALTVATI